MCRPKQLSLVAPHSFSPTDGPPGDYGHTSVCHALYEWEKKQQKYAGHMQHIFLPVGAFSRSPAAGLKANAPVPIFGADFPTQP